MVDIDALRRMAMEKKEHGLTNYEIADDLNLSKDTVAWLLSQEDTKMPEGEVKIGWRSIGVRPRRMEMMAETMTDIICEEAQKYDLEIDAILGIAINGLPYATFVAQQLDMDLCVYRPQFDRMGSFSSNYATPANKKIVIIDDVLGTGGTVRQTIKQTVAEGGEVVLVVTVVNKSDMNDVDGVPLRSLIRARAL